MTETVSDIIAARMREPEGLRAMVVWSVVAHVALVAFVVYMPASWRGETQEGPKTVMTISLGGVAGPQNGGMTQMGGRTVQAPAPEPVRRVEAPPAPKPPEMVLPTKTVRPRPQPKAAPKDATSRTVSTGDEPREGSSRVETGARGQGFGLTTGGGNGTGVRLDVGNFCCPEYLEQMVSAIRQNLEASQGVAGSVIMKFTATRAGTIEGVQLERSSGFVVHELAAQRALLLTRLPELPPQYPNPTLTVHVTFEFQR